MADSLAVDRATPALRSRDLSDSRRSFVDPRMVNDTFSFSSDIATTSATFLAFILSSLW